MLKRLALLVLTLVSVFGITNVSAQAPTNTQTIVGPATYTVVDGDTVWGLNPDDWPKIRLANAELFDQPGREFTLNDGRPGLLIKPGEVLNIPAGVTVTFRNSTPPTPTTPPTPPAPIVVAPTAPANYMTADGLWWLFPLLLLMLAFLALMLYLLLRRMREIEQRTLNTANSQGDRIMDRLDSLEANVMYGMQEAGDGLRGMFDDIMNFLLATRLRLRHDILVVVPPTETTAPINRVVVSGGVDFVEVHRQTGETISVLVRHGSQLTPQANGLKVRGEAIVLTAEATLAERQLHRERRAASGR